MAVISIAGGGNGSTGNLAADTLFYVADGTVWLSSDGGTSGIPFSAGEKVIRSGGLAITYQNRQPVPAVLITDPI